MMILKKLSFLALLFMPFVSAQAEDLTSVWKTLKKGNSKYVKNHQFAKERSQFVNSQNPNYALLSCADSRVTPEYIFNQGIGDLFVCRVAGNVADPVVIDSIEYAVAHFDLDAIIVMGHSNCGAVAGALKHLKANNGAIDQIEAGHLNSVLIPIETAIIEAGIDIYGSNALNLSIQANVAYVANQLMVNSTSITDAVNNGSLCIIGVVYDLSTGVATEQFFIP